MHSNDPKRLEGQRPGPHRNPLAPEIEHPQWRENEGERYLDGSSKTTRRDGARDTKNREAAVKKSPQASNQDLVRCRSSALRYEASLYNMKQVRGDRIAAAHPQPRTSGPCGVRRSWLPRSPSSPASSGKSQPTWDAGCGSRCSRRVPTHPRSTGPCQRWSGGFQRRRC